MTQPLDITQALKDAENALRDFISQVLGKELGNDWAEKCGVSPERLAVWRERKRVEEARQEAGVVEERILYYADFYDLKTILKKHWTHFSVALGDLKTMEVWLSTLERLRDPDAHRRELLPHQKHLALGIEGEIRSRLIRYRSKQETADDYFPRIESVRDNLGNIWTPGNSGLKIVQTDMTLRPGDVVDFTISARDPLDGPLQYGIRFSGLKHQWQDASNFQWNVADSDIGAFALVDLAIKSSRQFHASPSSDDNVKFAYIVLPRRS
jgi:hypothetical protein